MGPGGSAEDSDCERGLCVSNFIVVLIIRVNLVTLVPWVDEELKVSR